LGGRVGYAKLDEPIVMNKTVTTYYVDVKIGNGIEDDEQGQGKDKARRRMDKLKS